MPLAYSEDMRWRAVWLNIAHGMTTSRIGSVLSMSERSVQCYLALLHSTGSVDPKKPKPGPGGLLNELEQFSTGAAEAVYEWSGSTAGTLPIERVKDATARGIWACPPGNF